MSVKNLILAAFWVSSMVVKAALVEYTFNVQPRRSRPPLSPDCFTDRDMLLINDKNPGEVIRANVGDTVKVTIINHSPTEALTMHFHGITMYQQPYSDGAATRSTCNVGPMQTLVNEFLITKRDVGFHYYHGHSSLDRGDGLQGPIIIEDPLNPPPFTYDGELILFLQDWYQRAGPSQRTGLDSVPFIFPGNPNSYLINGKGRFSDCLNASSSTSLSGFCDPLCSSETYLPSLQVEPGKTYRVRVINAGNLIAINLAIANHTMTIVEADGTYVKPVTVSNLDIGVAQRYGFLLTADQAVGSYWIETVGRFRDGLPKGLGYLKYNDSPAPTNDSAKPLHPATNDVAAWAALDAALVTLNTSYYETSSILSGTTDKRYIVVGTQVNDDATGLLRWAVNNLTQTFPASPTLYSALRALEVPGAADWPDTNVPEFLDLPLVPKIPFNYTATLQSQSPLISTKLEAMGDVVMRLKKGEVVGIVMQNALALNGRAEYHAWHMHGHSFWVVGQGQGIFDPVLDPPKFNLVNPVRRDTLSLLPYGWTAIRFIADNPGAWPFHCTLATHAVMGMGLTIVTSPDLLPPPPPGLYSCMKTSINPADAEVCLNCVGFNKTCKTAYGAPPCCSGLICRKKVLRKGTCLKCARAGDKCRSDSDCCSNNCKAGGKCT